MISSLIDERIPTKKSFTLYSSKKINGPFDYSLSEPNVCVLDFAKYKIDNSDWQNELEILRIDRALRKKFNLEFRGGAMTQPWFLRKARGNVPPEIKCKLTLKFSFSVEKIPESDVFHVINSAKALISPMFASLK